MGEGFSALACGIILFVEMNGLGTKRNMWYLV